MLETQFAEISFCDLHMIFLQFGFEVGYGAEIFDFTMVFANIALSNRRNICTTVHTPRDTHKSWDPTKFNEKVDTGPVHDQIIHRYLEQAWQNVPDKCLLNNIKLFVSDWNFLLFIT